MRRVLLSLALVACTRTKTVVDPNATAIQATLHLDPSLGVDQVLVTVTQDSFCGTQPFAPGMLPTTPRPLASEETFDILVAASLDGAQLSVRVDGLANSTVVTSGGGAVTVHARAISDVDITLGAAAICGDGVVDTPLEACDVGNTAGTSGCSPSCCVEQGWVCTNPPGGASTCHLDTFDLVAAASTGNRQVTFTFSAPPDPIQATTLASYSVPGLTLSGTPFLSGNSVVVQTSSQSAIPYDAIVTSVTRASDGAALATSVASFVGRTSFNVASAASPSTTTMTVTFDAAPNATQATTLASYSVSGLVLTGTPTLSGNTITITTSTQTATNYTVSVANVTRASDGEPLSIASATFTGAGGFDVAGAASTSNRQMTVTFNAPPNAAQATTLSNYSVPGLTLNGVPMLSANTVTIATSSQSATMYTVAVSNVTRASDGRALSINTASFVGTAVSDPTVTGVVVISTSPSNGTTPYNTGTTTLAITGTQFSTVMCPIGVALDDLNGLGQPVGTQATSCAVNSDTSITATFPAGIRTNSTTGWDVIVTNSVGSNPTSAKFVPLAGLLVSEPFTGSSTTGSLHEFCELYNPTATSIDVGATGIALSFHVRTPTGTDVVKALTFINHVVPSHGYFLLVSQESTSADVWFSHRDATYNATTSDLESGGSAYISLSATDNAKVLDKAGWGAQPSGGYEGQVMSDIASDYSAERLPGGTLGHATDTDNNLADFAAPSTTITPQGTADPTQP